MKNSCETPSVSYSFVNKKALSLLCATVFLALAGCAETGISTDPTYRDKNLEDPYKYGSLVSDKGGWTIIGGDEKKKENNGLGVNGYLWRASLDTISFMPIASADPFGGIITTDWYSAPDAPNERAKMNILILDRELRADGVKVSVFRQTRSTKGEWVDAAVTPATATQLEETILTRARQLKLVNRKD